MENIVCVQSSVLVCVSLLEVAFFHLGEMGNQRGEAEEDVGGWICRYLFAMCFLSCGLVALEAAGTNKGFGFTKTLFHDLWLLLLPFPPLSNADMF